MVAILEKGKFNSDFHPMVDFIAASPLRIVPLFDSMLEHQGEGSGTPTEPHHTPSPEADTSHITTSSIPLPSIPTAPIPPVTQPDPTPIRQYSKRARIAQSSALSTVADEPASPVRDVSEGEATAERISNDSEEIARVLTSMDAATVLAGGINVPIGSGFIPTTGPPATVISTGSEIARDVEVARIHAEEELQGMIDSLDKSNETIANQQRRPMTKKQKREYYMAMIRNNLGWKVKDFKGMTFEEIEAKFAKVWKKVKDFIPIGSKEETERLKRKGLNLEQYSKRARIAQSSALLTVEDEPASPVRDVSEGEACPTESGFIPDQDRATIAKTSTLPHDLAPRVTSPAADEGSMQHTISKLTAICTSLQRQYSELLAKFQAQEEEIVRLKERVQALEDREGVVAKQSGDDAPIKGMSINEGEATAERISNDSEEIARVLTSMDAAIVLAWGIDVPTGSGFIPTDGPPATVISTGSEVSLTASLTVTKRKGKEVLVGSDPPKKKKLQEQIDAQVARELEEQQEKKDMRMNEQIARETEVARIHAEEELQGMIDSLDKSNETIAKPMTKKQKREYYMAMIRNNLGWKVKDFKGMTFEEIEAKFAEVWKQVEDFIPIRSKEETERLKRKGLNLEQEQVKKQKSSEEAPEIETSTEDFTEEKIKKMMLLVPIKDVYVQALQVKHPITDWKVYTKGQRSYWMIIRLGGSFACYQFFVDLLKQLDREDLNQLWALVKEYFSIKPATSEKEMEL
nr:hypothetical protein [Tanacetum cinerariifolium]